MVFWHKLALFYAIAGVCVIVICGALMCFHTSSGSCNGAPYDCYTNIVMSSSLLGLVGCEIIAFGCLCFAVYRAIVDV